MNGLLNWYLNLSMDIQGVVTLCILAMLFVVTAYLQFQLRIYPKLKKAEAAEMAADKEQREIAAQWSRETKRQFAAYAAAANNEARMSDIVRQTSNL